MNQSQVLLNAECSIQQIQTFTYDLDLWPLRLDRVKPCHGQQVALHRVHEVTSIVFHYYLFCWHLTWKWNFQRVLYPLIMDNTCTKFDKNPLYGLISVMPFDWPLTFSRISRVHSLVMNCASAKFEIHIGLVLTRSMCDTQREPSKCHYIIFAMCCAGVKNVRATLTLIPRWSKDCCRWLSICFLSNLSFGSPMTLS